MVDFILNAIYIAGLIIGIFLMWKIPSFKQRNDSQGVR